jgi:hypothetical protein
MDKVQKLSISDQPYGMYLQKFGNDWLNYRLSKGNKFCNLVDVLKLPVHPYIDAFAG